MWGYGRFSDLLMHLARIILIMVVGHYVDDFTGIEKVRTAMFAFESFEEVNEILGATMKRTKRAPPVRALPHLGVILEMGPDFVSVSPTPNRRQKIRSVGQKHLVANTVAHGCWQPCWKSNFLQPVMHGTGGPCRILTSICSSSRQPSCYNRERLTPSSVRYYCEDRY